MGSAESELINNGVPWMSSNVDNNTATATAPAMQAQRHFVMGLILSFSAVPSAAYKLVRILVGGVEVLAFHWVGTNSPAVIPLPGIIRGGYNQAVTAELGASGTGGVTGRVTLITAPR